ncbi:hypothetical protein [Janthinobacterium sp. MDT1-19]|uniref:hypothetical protein n=1 Tax=Janthinobacterium sp. MDT1-19 TaxID=1259339 RepID=UPI003F22E430
MNNNASIDALEQGGPLSVAVTPQHLAVPDGWKLVPVEPTPEIIAGAAIASWPTATLADIDLARQAAPLVLMQMDMAPGTTVDALAGMLATMAPAYRAMLAAAPAAPAQEQLAAPDDSFQSRVQPWMMECFGAAISADGAERNHRFLEESLELVQACGCTASEAHQLVDYVYGRPVGERAQEVGGVMVTLAALCLAQGLDMHAAGETELARIWTKVEAIRAKQAAKPKHSPLPAAAPQPIIGRLMDQISALPVLWGLNEPGALLRNSDVFRVLVAAGREQASQEAVLVQYIPSNFTTHRSAWRDAISECINVEQVAGNANQAAYWQHELAAFDRSFDRLLAGEVRQAAPVQRQEPVAWRRMAKHAWEYRTSPPTEKMKGQGWLPLADAAPVQPVAVPVAMENVDVCAEIRALCSACGGTGDVHRADGEWLGECTCVHAPRQRQELQALGAHPAPCARNCEAPAFQSLVRERNARIAELEAQLVRRRAPLSPETQQAIAVARAAGQTITATPAGLVFMNDGAEPGTSELDCPACGGSGHAGDVAARSAP